MTDTYKLTCDSEDGAHEWKRYQCVRCGTAFDSPYECEFANAAAREIRRLEDTLAACREAARCHADRTQQVRGEVRQRDATIAELRLAAEHYHKQHDEHVAQLRKEYEETVEDLREQLARVRVSPVPLSELRNIELLLDVENLPRWKPHIVVDEPSSEAREVGHD